MAKTVHKTTIEERFYELFPAEFLGEIKKQIEQSQDPKLQAAMQHAIGAKNILRGLSTEETLLGEEVVPTPIGILVQRSHTTHGFGHSCFFRGVILGGDRMRTTLLGFAEHYCDEFAADTLDFDNPIINNPPTLETQRRFWGTLLVDTQGGRAYATLTSGVSQKCTLRDRAVVQTEWALVCPKI